MSPTQWIGAVLLAWGVLGFVLYRKTFRQWL